ncbi:unnamed protein product [Cyprideis torosa]|uniref:Uncharacterized protein n=1 Tax=Cyprideis torosa TaxID=163714 RepID=A0A7R8WGM3_9CRUS|nr:unnamed protein product [Cyprideis torosa]CAG0895475.1 unnamed protein product [Cyprideis torosa]
MAITHTEHRFTWNGPPFRLRRDELQHVEKRWNGPIAGQPLPAAPPTKIINATEGDAISLDCDHRFLAWKKNGALFKPSVGGRIEIPGRDNSLHFYYVEDTDSGRYSCHWTSSNPEDIVRDVIFNDYQLNVRQAGPSMEGQS